MVYSREEAAKRAEEATVNTPRMCQAWTRGILGAPSVGDQDGDGDADAVDGWRSEPNSAKHTDRKPPRGTPVAWGGGSSGFGHRAISLGPINGVYMIRSTDAGGSGRIATVPLAWVEAQWGMTYLGWSDTISGLKIPFTPPVERRVIDLETIQHNVNIMQDPKDVRRQLISDITKYNPDAFVLFEARRLAGHLEDLGYDVIQFEAKNQASGNVAILVRKNLVLAKKGTLRMKRLWRGPKLGIMQDPRIYRFVKIKKGGVTWKLGGFHYPFGARPRRESILATRAWFLSTTTKRPVIALMDSNLRKSAVEGNLADPVKAKIAGTGIDLAVYKNCGLAEQHVIGKRGSDHEAYRSIFRKVRKIRRR